MKKERNWKQCSKKIVCVLLTASMLFTNTGISVYAQEEMQTAESEERLEMQETEENLETEKTEEEIPVETFVAEEPQKTAETEVLSEGISAERDESDKQETTTAQTLTETVDEEKSTEEDLNWEEGVPDGPEEPVEPVKPVAQGTYKDIAWSIDRNGKLLVEGTGDFSASTDERRVPWYEYRENIKTAEIKVKGMTDASHMFESCSNLTDVDLSEFDTSSVTNMSSMFAFCSSLARIDVSQFDTRNVTDMRVMFCFCESLTSLDVTNFNTGNVTDMRGMFSRCGSLTSLDVTNFNTENVKDMGGMFGGCSGLTSLDLSSFDAGNITDMWDMRDMLDDCSALETINTPYNVSLDVELPLGTMSDLEGNIYSCAWYDKDERAYGYLPKGLSESILLEKRKYEDIKWSLDENGKLTVEGTGDFPGGNGYGKIPWYELRSEIKTAEIKMSGMTDASSMFYWCENLTSVDFSGFDAENVTNMEYMFYNCSSLTSVNFSGFHAGNVTDMSHMFSGCSNLTSLDLSGFHAENVTNMENMFSGCSSLTSLDLSSFHAENITNMGEMFWSCSSLTSLNLSSFDVGNVTDWYRVSLYDCSALETINTPRNVPSSIRLPITELDSQGNICTYAWYAPDGKKYSSIPKGLSESVLLEKKKFEDIIWNIDENGKLTVEGTGDFPGEPGSDRIIPWEQYRSVIKTAEIKMSGMTDASYMFFECQNLTSVDFSGFDTSSITNMSHMFSGCMNLINVDFSGLDTSKVTDMSYMFGNCKTLPSIDFSGLDTRSVTNMSGMFSGCNLVNVDFSGLDTRNVTNMSSMFSSCNLPSIDFSSFDTSKVTDMGDMFYGCENLTNVDFSGLNTKNVTNMSGMFSDCDLANVDFSSLDTSKVTDMSYMFAMCRTLPSVDFSGFNTENVTNMSGMFSECKLTDLDLSGLGTANVTDMSYMFGDCSGLTNLKLGNFNTGKVTDMSSMFYGCRHLASLNLSSFNTENVANMTEMFSYCYSLSELDLSGFNTGKVTDMSYMFAECRSLTNLNLSSFNMENVTQFDSLFEDCYALAKINTPSKLSLSVKLPVGIWYDSERNEYTELPTGRNDSILLTLGAVDIVNNGTYEKITWSIDARGKLLVEGEGDFAPRSIGNIDIDTERAPWYEYHEKIKTAEIKVQGMTDASYMFFDCNELMNLDLSKFNTENITDMSFMFSNCNSLINLDLSDFKTENVTNMRGMFSGMTSNCYGPISLDLSGFNTVSVTNMSNMFSECEALTSLNLSSFDTGNVTDMSGMFEGCYGLTSLDVSDFNTGNVTDMNSMFLSCYELADLDISSFKTENVTNMWAMFSGCEKLTNLYLNNFNTGNVTDMSDMFSYCYVLTSLDLSSFDVGNVTNMAGMFNGCEDLTQIYTPLNVPDFGDDNILPDGIWYDLGGNEYTKLPIGKSSTILLTKDKIPDITAYITATKTKKTYTVGDTISINDLKVMYYSTDGTVKTLQSSEYTTNVNDLDTSKSGEVILTITYQNMTASVKLTISKKEEGNDTDDEDDSSYEDSERTDLSAVNATIANIKEKVYDQNEYEPVVKVTATINGKKTTLTEGADYRVSYKNNVKAGTGTVTVCGNGIYKGELEKQFIINPKPVKKLKIVTGSFAGSITGNDLSKLPVYVYDGTTLLQFGTDYTLSDYSTVKATAATVTVKAAGDSNYTGSTTAKLNVYEAGTKIINPENVTLDKESVPYTGKAIKDVKPTVKVGETTLTTKDYKVQYQNNKDAGTAFVIVTGKGEYKGKVVKPFTISAAVSNPITIKQIPDKTYNGKLQKPTVTVSVNSDGKTKKLSKNKDYKVVYKNNFHAGKATVTVTGKGNYAGLSATAEFTIKPQAIKKVSVKGTQGNLSLVYSKKVLKEGTDYKTPVYGTPNKNKVSVKLEGIGDFEGEVTKNVKTN